MEKFGVGLCALLLLATACHAGRPPIGVWKGSASAAQEQPALEGALDQRPLVERCKEQWRNTRLDHFT